MSTAPETARSASLDEERREGLDGVLQAIRVPQPDAACLAACA